MLILAIFREHLASQIPPKAARSKQFLKNNIRRKLVSIKTIVFYLIKFLFNCMRFLLFFLLGVILKRIDGDGDGDDGDSDR